MFPGQAKVQEQTLAFVAFVQITLILHVFLELILNTQRSLSRAAAHQFLHTSDFDCCPDLFCIAI